MKLSSLYVHDFKGYREHLFDLQGKSTVLFGVSSSLVQLKSCISLPMSESSQYSPFTYKICAPSSNGFPSVRFMFWIKYTGLPAL